MLTLAASGPVYMRDTSLYTHHREALGLQTCDKPAYMQLLPFMYIKTPAVT